MIRRSTRLLGAAAAPSPQPIEVSIDSSPRPRLERTYADQGVYAPQSRHRSRGLFHWTHYGVLPKATIDDEGRKVFEWRGLFIGSKGNRRFQMSVSGEDFLRVPEFMVEFYDLVRIRWLNKRYGKLTYKHMNNFGVSIGLSERMRQTWHTGTISDS